MCLFIERDVIKNIVLLCFFSQVVKDSQKLRRAHAIFYLSNEVLFNNVQRDQIIFLQLAVFLNVLNNVIEQEEDLWVLESGSLEVEK